MTQKAAPPETALITGATAGLGAEFARQLAEAGCNLVLVARDRGRLERACTELSARYGINAEFIEADLLTEAGVSAVVDRLRAGNSAGAGRRSAVSGGGKRPLAPVTLLVNNAGFGVKEPFEKANLQSELDLVNIMVTVPMQLMHAALEGMLTRRAGRIINVASVAAYTPRDNYAACKAWVVSFSRWAHYRYARRGIAVTALCPGFVHTEFHQRMGMSKKLYPQWMWLTPERVVREGLADLMAGKPVSVPSKRYKVLAAVAGLGPKRVVARLASVGR
jgi:uncharacterized protein